MSCQSCGQNRAFSNKPLFSTRQKSGRECQAPLRLQALASIVGQEVSQTICVLSNMGRSVALGLLLVTLVVMTGCDVFWPPDGASVAPNIQQYSQQTISAVLELPSLVSSSTTAWKHCTLEALHLCQLDFKVGQPLRLGFSLQSCNNCNANVRHCRHRCLLTSCCHETSVTLKAAECALL